jgi:hypothetical protein
MREPVVMGTTAAAVALVVGLRVYFALRKKPTAEELERRRRDFVMQHGRIIDGAVLDFQEVAVSGASAEPDEHAKPAVQYFVVYKYEIAGVVYECSQDVTHVGGRGNQFKATPGLPVSVRYVPSNPGNSIVAAEAWSGLRDIASLSAAPGQGEARGRADEPGHERSADEMAHSGN